MKKCHRNLIFILIFFNISISIASSYKIELFGLNKTIEEKEVLEISFSVIEDDKNKPSNQENKVFAQFEQEEEYIFGLDRKKFEINLKEDINKKFFLKLEGKYLGITRLNYQLVQLSSKKGKVIILYEGSEEVKVKRKFQAITFYFPIIIGVFVAINNINMGVMLDMEIIKRVMRKPIAPLIGMLSQFLFMPLASIGIGRLFFPDKVAWRFALFILGCSPGGTVSNFWTLLFHGDVNLSITMTFFSTLLALGMMPLWIFTMGWLVTADSDVKIPYLNIILSLIAITIPISLGIIVKRYFPKMANISRKIIRPFTFILIVFILVTAFYINFYLFYLLTWTMILAGCCIAWGGYCFGAIFAAIAQLTRPQIIAVSIETALQNPGIAFVLLLTSFPQPDADLAALPIVGQLIVTGPPLWITLLIVTIYRRCCKKKEETTEVDMGVIKREIEPFLQPKRVSIDDVTIKSYV